MPAAWQRFDRGAAIARNVVIDVKLSEPVDDGEDANKMPARLKNRAGVDTGDGTWDQWTLDMHGGEDLDQKQVDDVSVKKGEEQLSMDRTVKVEDVRDINELLKLPNPLKPSLTMRLAAITLDDGQRLDRPSVDELRKCKPSKLRPVLLHWKDQSLSQAKAPKEHDEFIRRLLNLGPADSEDLIRANWQQFDAGFFFRITELREDTTDERLKQKLMNLEKLAGAIVAAAQRQMRKTVPEAAEDTQAILNSLLEADGETLLWPPPAESYKRLADVVTKLSNRAKQSNSWYETQLEVMERFGNKMHIEDKKELEGWSKIAIQRLITEWLRQDSLWEETKEGEFLYQLMLLDHQQWDGQWGLSKDTLNPGRLRDELKIISESKVMALPMASKLQVYAAKYVQGLVKFIESKVDAVEMSGQSVR